VVNKEYIDKSFNLIDPNDKTIIETIIADYVLNNEQERAFRIIANHATMKNPTELCMYLGGMGGTGKSQVIKAVMDFFDRHQENHRFLVVAPTGAAAALLNGSTYHSVLGINDGEFISAKSLAQIRADLMELIIFFWMKYLCYPVMICIKSALNVLKLVVNIMHPWWNQFYICRRFCSTSTCYECPPLYSGDVGTQVESSQTVRGQEAAIGKALWHQVTVVVILRQNMRQSKQSLKIP